MGFSIHGLYLNGQRDAAFTDDPHPELELRTNGGIPDAIQITVFFGGMQVWSGSERPESCPFFRIPIALEGRSSYEVRLSAQKNGVEDTARLTIHTGFMGAQWEAHWIEPEQENAIPEERITFNENFLPWADPEPLGKGLRPGREVRVCFHLDGLPDRAVLYATAHGVYTPMLNGVCLGSGRLAPEITPYQSMLYYQRYDVLSALCPGENELRFELADGWYIGRIGLSGSSCQYGDRLGLLAQLELTSADGIKTVIASGNGFEGRRSNLDYSDLYIGERRDLTRSGETWSPCRVLGPSGPELTAQPIPQLSITQKPIGTLSVNKSGELIADFGQTIAGVVSLTWETTRTGCVVLEHCEALDRDGTFFRNIMGRNKQQRDTVVFAPGRNHFEPLHTYHGFRYVKITGLTMDEIKSIAAKTIGTPLEFTGAFRCSDDRLNKLQNCIQWSMRGNMASIPTDCPQREKMGWTGDIQIFTPTGCFNAELLGFLSAWLAQMRAEQRANGEIPNEIPAFPAEDQMSRELWGDNTSAAWGDACVLVPWYLYQCTGNISVLWENLEMMERWLAFIHQAAQVRPENYDKLSSAEQTRCPYLWRAGHQFGDWLIPSLCAGPEDIEKGTQLTADVVASCQYAVTMGTWMQVLEVLLRERGDPALQKKLDQAGELLICIREAVRAQYVSDDGSVQGGMQGSYVMVLYAGTVDGALKDKVAARLAQLIQENGGQLDTGFVSTPHLLDVLWENGYRKLVYQLLYSEKMPSWLYMVGQGATTIWERWSAVLPDGTVTTSSMNHYSLGSVGNWMYQKLGGITAIQPGYREILFHPEFDCGLEWCECEKRTAFGTVSCQWKRENGKVRVCIDTPVKAKIAFLEQTKSVSPGRYEFDLRLDVNL